MFSNIGEKIKITTKVFCWLLIVLFVILGIALLVSGAVLNGIILLIAGPLTAWVRIFLSGRKLMLVQTAASCA